MDAFFEPGAEILVAATAEDLVSHLRNTSPDRARAIGQAARARVLRDHTYTQRSELLEQVMNRPSPIAMGEVT